MKSWQKKILVICCILGMGVSFVYHLNYNIANIGETRAPVYVNIEIDKAHMQSVSILAAQNNGDIIYPPSKEVTNELKNVILYSKIEWNGINPLIRGLSLRIPKEAAHETLNAIKGIGIFIGNRAFYFSHSDVINLKGKEQGDVLLYELNALGYSKSISSILLNSPGFINWYGDFNLAVKAASTFFIHPEKFIVTWCLILCLFILCRSNIENIYSAMRKQKKLSPELLLLGFIVLVGFILRINGYVRYSSWADELYSACQASNPTLLFMNTFGDSGNPPFYFILLRFWFMLFGWTEQSGRLFSVLTGCAAIISLYILVKRFADKKAAFLSALYMAVSAYLIGFSQEMRAYILEVFLVSIVAFRFLTIIQKRELSFIDLICYIIPSVLLVNTHYFGSLFIFATFLFYIVYSVRTKTFTWKKTILFFIGNIMIASSLLPFFIHTALQKALLDSSFNAFGKLGLRLICITAIIPLSGILYIYLKRTIIQKTLSNTHSCFLDYSLFVTAAVYLIAFGISLYRPILSVTYLIILYPLLVAIVAIILINVFANNLKLISGLCIGFAFIWVAGGYEAERGGHTGVYKESQSYISKDAEAHFQNTSMQKLSWFGDVANFYGYKELPSFVPGDNYDVLYFTTQSGNAIYSEIAALGISRDRILRIRVSNSESVLKYFPVRNIPPFSGNAKRASYSPQCELVE